MTYCAFNVGVILKMLTLHTRYLMIRWADCNVKFDLFFQRDKPFRDRDKRFNTPTTFPAVFCPKTNKALQIA